MFLEINFLKATQYIHPLFFYQYYWRSRVEIDAFDFSHVKSLFLEIVFNICDLLYGDQRVVGDPSSFKKNFRDLMNLVKTDFFKHPCFVVVLSATCAHICFIIACLVGAACLLVGAACFIVYFHCFAMIRRIAHCLTTQSLCGDVEATEFCHPGYRKVA